MLVSLYFAVILTFSQALQMFSAAPHWDKLERKGCSGTKCGWGVFESRILDAGNDWESACKNTPLSYKGGTYKSLKCIKTTAFGIATGMYGQFELESQDCGKWGDLKKDQCTKPGHRQYSAVLWNIPSNWKWEDCCKNIDIVPKSGIVRKKADRCKNVVINEWGEFDLPDITCEPDDVCKMKKLGSNPKDELKKKEETQDKQMTQDKQDKQDKQMTQDKQDKQDKQENDANDKVKKQADKPNGNTGFYRFAADLVCAAALAAVNTINSNNDPVREYRQGHNDRIEYLYAVVQHRHLNTGSNPTQEMRNFARAMGRPNDDAGHIVANRLGGTGARRYNIFPQAPNMNRGVWAQTEATAANFLQRNPNGFVEIFFTFDYASNTSTRPTRFTFRYAFSDGTEHTGEVINP